MEPLWLDDISVLYTNCADISIWPSVDETTQSKHGNCNCVVRFIILYALILSMYKQNTWPIQSVFIILGVVWILYYLKDNSRGALSSINLEYNVYTNDKNLNPLGLKGDPSTFNQITDPPAPAETDPNSELYSCVDQVARCYPMVSMESKECQKITSSNPFGNPPSGSRNEIPTCLNQTEESNELFFSGLPVNELDIFKKENSLRQFYTVPVTTDINQQSEFALWCYSSSTDRTHENTMVKLDK
jgi:hypothetical protein